jgi:uncharacterized protein YgiB involved in biofilm formation
MKRSTSLRLTLMSAAAATLGGCGESTPPAPPAFTTVQDCVLGGFAEAECRNAYEDAFKAHIERAPRFASRQDCEGKVDVDHCVETPVRMPDGTTSNVFVPLMAGYVLGRVLAPPPQQGTGGGGGGGYYGGSGRGEPIYRSRDYPGNIRDGGNLTTSRQGGGAVSTPPSRPANINTTTVSRSGFGSSGGSYGSGSS